MGGLAQAETPSSTTAPSTAEGNSQKGAAGGASPQESWIKVCNTPKDQEQQEGKQICLVTQELRSDVGQFLASVAIREVAGESRKTLLVAVPPGMLIQPGLRVQIDESEPQQAKYGICFPNACYAELVIEQGFIDSLKKGGKLVVTTLNQQAKALSFNMSLIGFTKVYDGPALDPQEVEQRQKALQSQLQKRAEEARKKLIEEQEKALQSEGTTGGNSGTVPTP